MRIGVAEIDRKYEVLGKLGEGGMGAVYKVRHRLLDEPRVIKTIRPQLEIDNDLQERFKREARVAAQLRHPNIAIVHDFSVGEDGTAYIVMEYVEGKNLRQYQRTEQPLGMGQVIEVARQALDALSYLHGKHFIHRDISSDNMMLHWNGGRIEVKLIDLGLAKSLHSDQQWHTRTGMVVGKVRYISPEQLNAGMAGVEIDHRSDLYSFGVVLYELATRQFPITGEDEMSMIAGHLYRPPKSFDETDPEARVPAGLRQVILKALEKVPADRFASAEDFSRALEGCGLQPTHSAGGSQGRSSEVMSEQVTLSLATSAETAPALARGAAASTATMRSVAAEEDLSPTVAMDSPAAVPAPVAVAAEPTVVRPTPGTAPTAPSGRRVGRVPGRMLAALAAVVIVLVGGWYSWRGGARSGGEAGPGTPAEARTAAVEDVFYGNNHALVIGNDEYQKLLPLETAVNDARAVARLLERRYGFEVRLLENVDRQQLISALFDFNESLTARDNLLIYYAGHGQLQGQSVYWQAIDADPDRSSQWINTRYEISGVLKQSLARHILVIADSCYAGAMGGPAAAQPTAPSDPGQVRELAKRNSRLVLSSGGLSPVLDTGGARHSLFARVLLETLGGNRDVVGVSRLFPTIREEVLKAASERGGEQVPVLAPIPDSFDEGGELFFVPTPPSVG